MGVQETGVGEPVLHKIRVNDVELAYFERHRQLRGRGPTLHLVHATGFHARVWDQIIARLPAVHSIAVDQRGHGRSENVQIGHWKTMGQDQAALIEALDLTNVVGVGHSMGGHAIIEAAAACPERFMRLLLVDPTVAEPEAYATGKLPISYEGDTHPAVKRRNRYASTEDMVDRLRGKSSFPLFDPKMLRDYCEHGLLPAEDGDGFVLACPPEVEASVYATSRSNGAVYDSVRRLTLPVLVLRAMAPRPDITGAATFAVSPTWPGLAAEFQNGREIHFADKTHFLPMEIPDQVADLIRGELAQASR